MRVKPFRADSSLLYRKLAWTPGHHGANYGNLMPMGTTQGLTQGELEHVRRWLEAGAPRAGFERECFTYRRLGNAEPLLVTRIEMRMHPGSRHLLVQTFDERETAAPCDTRPAPDVTRSSSPSRPVSRSCCHRTRRSI